MTFEGRFRLMGEIHFCRGGFSQKIILYAIKSNFHRPGAGFNDGDPFCVFFPLKHSLSTHWNDSPLVSLKFYSRKALTTDFLTMQGGDENPPLLATHKLEICFHLTNALKISHFLIFFKFLGHPKLFSRPVKLGGGAVSHILKKKQEERVWMRKLQKQQKKKTQTRV